MNALWEFKSYRRDTTVSLGAIGVLSVMTSPEYDQSGVSLARLVSLAPDGPSEVMALLAELVEAGYATRHDGPPTAVCRSVWRATDKAFLTSTELVG